MITPDDIKARKKSKKIIALTAYDYTFAKMIDMPEVDIILVGDSVGMVCHGDKDTKSVTIENMIYHIESVARAVSHALVVGDMPAGTYSEPRSAVVNAKKLIKAGAEAVKIEERPGAYAAVKALVAEGIFVMGHVGLTPQTAASFKVQGRDNDEAERIVDEASRFAEAGGFAIVLECIPTHLAKRITEAISIPTIGIGAGRYCDGQVLVTYDLLGMFQDFRPKFVRTFFNGAEQVADALIAFRKAVEAEDFPSDCESFK